MVGFGKTFWRDERGAVAPTLALVLFALVAAGGIAFDYARMATLDTELQNAADQAALAAAGQLDGSAGARGRATSAAQTLVSNLTYFANDGGTTAITIPTIVYYRDYDAATGDKGPVASNDAEANYVEVEVGARRADFALTPIVGALSSGALTAHAFAGLGSAICDMPPFMMCNPSEPDDNADENLPFNTNLYIGRGLHLVTGRPDAPGNFGFLQTGFGSGAENMAKAIGWDTFPGGCVGTRGVTTEPGNMDRVRNAYNTRFDIPRDNDTNACPAGDDCSPSTNVRKDLVTNSQGQGVHCGTGSNNRWRQSANPYGGRADGALLASDGSQDPDIIGHPRDACHYATNGCVGGRIGDGTWDRDAYFRVNYGWDAATWQAQTGLSATTTRYEVYMWEAANPATANRRQPLSGDPAGYSYPVCRPPGIAPTVASDRRKMMAAVINCNAVNLHGRDTNVPVTRWIEFFLVEPAFTRTRVSDGVQITDDKDIYVEVLGEVTAPDIGSTGGPMTRRDVPMLIE